MRSLPTGTVTFLFTDIEGSTRLLTRLGAGYPTVLARHNAIVRGAVASKGGVEVKTEGDSFFCVFSRAPDALAAAVDAQRALAAEAWPDAAAVRVRMGLHTGVGELSEGDYVGLDVHRAARVAAAAHGGQLLATDQLRSLVADALPEGAAFRDLGEHQLRDLPAPERLYQVTVDGLASDFPPLRTMATGAGNLPSPPTAFYGREREVEALDALLLGARLITLTGPGGTGKTRLSIAVAGRVRSRFPDGAWFVALDTVRDPDLVVPTIASTLGVKEALTRLAEDAVAERLASRQTLLVLDNLEQVLPAAPAIGRLVAAAPSVRVLCSSREALHVPGEQQYPVPPLPADPAVALFLDRARLARPDFAPDDHAMEDIRTLVEAVDRLPLAIELAAARIRVLTPKQILDRLGDRLGLLSGGARDVPDRQRTLRGAIEWSEELLPVEERRFFARMAVFAGSPSIDAIEGVLQPEQDLGLDTLDATASMVEKSLLYVADAPDDEPRFGMLETIRAFAAERLEDDPAAPSLRERHALWYQAEAERLEPELGGRQPDRFLKQLDADNDELRATIRWSLANDRPDVGLRTAAAIWRFWQHRWHLGEGRALLTELLAHPGAQAETAERAGGVTALAGVAYWQGDYTAAHVMYVDAVASYRRLGDEPGIANALYNLSFTSSITGDLDGAARLHEQAYAAYEHLGDERGMTLVREAMAVLAQMRGDSATAEALLKDVIAYYRRVGAQFKLSDSLTFASVVALRNDDPDGAAARVAEGIRIARRIGDHSTQAIGLQLGALVTLARNDAREAAVLAGAYAALRASGDPFLSPTETLGMPDPEAAARAAMDEATFEQAFEEGRQLSLDQALDRVLAATQR